MGVKGPILIRIAIKNDMSPLRPNPQIKGPGFFEAVFGEASGGATCLDCSYGDIA